MDFRTVQGSTEITLTHEGLIIDEDRQDHRQGWEGCFDSLERTLRGEVF